MRELHDYASALVFWGIALAILTDPIERFFTRALRVTECRSNPSTFDTLRKWLICIAGAAWGVLLVTNFYLPGQGPHEEQECGPGHHWRMVNPQTNSDLSCEEDRR